MCVNYILLGIIVSIVTTGMVSIIQSVKWNSGWFNDLLY